MVPAAPPSENFGQSEEVDHFCYGVKCVVLSLMLETRRHKDTKSQFLLLQTKNIREERLKRWNTKAQSREDTK